MSRSSAAIEAEVAAKRQALQASLSDIRERLAPRELAHELTGSVGDRVAAAGQAIGDKASTPGGLVALCGMAFASAFALGGGLRPGVFEPGAKSVAVLPPSPQADDSPALTRDNVVMLGQLAAAIATGAVASRFLPPPRTERDLFAGIGPEIRRTLAQRVETGAERIASPRSGRFGLLNLAAMVAAAALTKKR